MCLPHEFDFVPWPSPYNFDTIGLLWKKTPPTFGFRLGWSQHSILAWGKSFIQQCQVGCFHFEMEKDFLKKSYRHLQCKRLHKYCHLRMKQIKAEPLPTVIFIEFIAFPDFSLDQFSTFLLWISSFHIDYPLTLQPLILSHFPYCPQLGIKPHCKSLLTK